MSFDKIAELSKQIKQQFGYDSWQYEVFKEMHIVYLTNTPSSFDNRQVKCCCNNPNCKTGLNFDTLTNGNTCILLTDTNGNEHPMHTNAETIKQIAENLNNYIGTKLHYSEWIKNKSDKTHDSRMIKCACGEQDCEQGIWFDDNYEHSVTIVLGEKENHSLIYLNKNNTIKLIEILNRLLKNHINA